MHRYRICCGSSNTHRRQGYNTKGHVRLALWQVHSHAIRFEPIGTMQIKYVK